MDNNSPQVTGPNAQQQFQVDDIPGEPMLLLLLVLGLLVSVGIIWYCYYVEMRRVSTERREARVTNNAPSRPAATPEQQVDERTYSKSGLPPIVVMPGGDLAFGQLVPEDVEAAPGAAPVASAAEGSGQAPNEEDMPPSKRPIIWTSLTLSRSATLHDLLHRASVWFATATSGTLATEGQPADKPAASTASAASSAAAAAAGSAAGREAAEAPTNDAAAEAAPQQTAVVDVSRMVMPRSSSINSTDSLGIWYPPLTPPRMPPSALRPATQQVELAPAPAPAAEGEEGQAEAAGEERTR